jgi:Tfp pilus assembly protein PilV
VVVKAVGVVRGGVVDGAGDGRRLGNESGLTIVETMAAIVILAVAFLGMAGVQAVSSRAQTLGKNQGLATYVANQQLEKMRAKAFANVEVPTDPNDLSKTIEGVTSRNRST